MGFTNILQVGVVVLLGSVVPVQTVNIVNIALKMEVSVAFVDRIKKQKLFKKQFPAPTKTQNPLFFNGFVFKTANYHKDSILFHMRRVKP